MTGRTITLTIKADASRLRRELERTQFRLHSYILDREVLQRYRWLRIQAGHTDHKRELRRERWPRNLERLSRLIRKSGVELGWLWPAPTWPWPTFVPRARPFDHEID